MVTNLFPDRRPDCGPSWGPIRYVNFDANASVGVLPEVAERLEQLPRHALNPSATHRAGQAARELVEEARTEVAELLGTNTRESRIIFTSGATEANNLAVFGPFLNFLEEARHLPAELHLVTTTVEHPSVAEPFNRLERMGAKVTRISPSSGTIGVADVVAACTPHTALISCMSANNETGHVFPVRECAPFVKERSRRAIFHSDAVQALGKMPLTFSELGVDMLSVSGHKIGALPGVGALVCKRTIPPMALILGGPQETRFRAGTENVPGIVSLGVAAQVVRQTLEARISAMRTIRDYICEVLGRDLQPLTFNQPSSGLANTLSVTLPGISAIDVVIALDLEGVHVSAGAACSSGKSEGSIILREFGASVEEAAATLRVSVEPHYGAGELERATYAIVRAVRRARGALP